jgi:hypothetical protein
MVQELLSWVIQKKKEKRKNTTFQVNDFIVGGGTCIIG